MSKLQRVIGNIEPTRDLVLLLLIGGLYSLSVALSNTFVNIFLWKQSGEYVDLGLYNLAAVVLQPIAFIIAGKWAKKVDRVIVLRLGVIFLAFFYISVLLVGDKASSYLLLLGSLLGIGSGFYWLAFNVLTFEITDPENRDFFNGFLGLLSSFGGMIGPISAGLIISKMKAYTGYSVIFGISLALFAIAVFLSFSIKRRPANGKYFFKRIIKERKYNKNWKKITNAHFFQGFREGTYAFVVSVFVFIATGSELALGTFGLINSGIALVCYYIASRWIKKEHRKRAVLVGGVLLFLSIFLLVFHITYVNLLLYAALIAIAYPLLLVPYSSMTYDVIGTAWKAAEMRIEYIVVRELFLNIGRVLSLLFFIVGVIYFDDHVILPILLVILGVGHSMIYFFIKNIE